MATESWRWASRFWPSITVIPMAGRTSCVVNTVRWSVCRPDSPVGRDTWVHIAEYFSSRSTDSMAGEREREREKRKKEKRGKRKAKNTRTPSPLSPLTSDETVLTQPDDADDGTRYVSRYDGDGMTALSGTAEDRCLEDLAPGRSRRKERRPAFVCAPAEVAGTVAPIDTYSNRYSNRHSITGRHVLLGAPWVAV
ncbi:hypothetical protein BZA05DRAFT_185925 [Tricharina praecox]|uniref:uncharacterized protein n=1 Tax=Tricharina praecox TaxID=43433 RepID=UPI00221E63FD|nr:uncharacterized protein BZA05DRAFT_185925 [Tricharina praecox]KAI5843282.1 hypothetical protein BZA05DRAFT_185925 [Tricharina praecox]